MKLIVDSHNDLAWNMFAFGRDYTRSAMDTRRLEAGTRTVTQNGDALIGWPEYQRGQVVVVFSTLYATPFRFRVYENETQVYQTFDEAYKLYLDQLMSYHRLTDSHPDKFRLLGSSSDLKLLLDEWQTPSESGHPVGLIPLMEGGEGIRTPAELEEWFERGVRLIGPAWAGTRYCGGTNEPGPLTDEGRALLSAMADFNFFLDLSHMDEASALEALDSYSGPIVATHGNCLALLPNYPTNRQFSDRVLRGVIERDGVIGVVPYNVFLKPGWKRDTNRRDEVHLADVIAHIDHICQLAGDSLHVGIGSDFDGGFGVQSVPPEIDTVADLQKIGSLLSERGYSETDVTNILGENWLTRLLKELPSS
ncbi:MAG TPA: membrane dipeptidase [Anaerolineales bacterium]|nr:membrane dipeptidase [Anaerolineales bacterium]